MIFVFLWLTSLSMIISRFIPIAANGIISLFLMTELYSIVYMHHVFFIHSSVDGHLSCFRVLAVKKSAAMNIGVQMAFYFYLAYSLGKLHSFILQVFSEDPTGHMKMDET